jgi:mannose-6-phosphate isomerase-like protein (cupin superfamily)
MKNGWFIGNFEPNAFRTGDLEAAVKTYKAGDHEEAHFHKIATEMTVVVSGEVAMNGKRYGSGKIVIMEPGDVTDFRAVTDAVLAVVKVPGVKNDKYRA